MCNVACRLRCDLEHETQRAACPFTRDCPRHKPNLRSHRTDLPTNVNTLAEFATFMYGIPNLFNVFIYRMCCSLFAPTSSKDFWKSQRRESICINVVYLCFWCHVHIYFRRIFIDLKQWSIGIFLTNNFCKLTIFF